MKYSKTDKLAWAKTLKFFNKFDLNLNNIKEINLDYKSISTNRDIIFGDYKSTPNNILKYISKLPNLLNFKLNGLYDNHLSLKFYYNSLSLNYILDMKNLEKLVLTNVKDIFCLMKNIENLTNLKHLSVYDWEEEFQIPSNIKLESLTILLDDYPYEDNIIKNLESLNSVQKLIVGTKEVGTIQKIRNLKNLHLSLYDLGHRNLSEQELSKLTDDINLLQNLVSLEIMQNFFELDKEDFTKMSFHSLSGFKNIKKVIIYLFFRDNITELKQVIEKEKLENIFLKFTTLNNDLYFWLEYILDINLLGFEMLFKIPSRLPLSNNKDYENCYDIEHFIKNILQVKTVKNFSILIDDIELLTFTKYTDEVKSFIRNILDNEFIKQLTFKCDLEN